MEAFGGGAAGWRITAILYTVIMLAFNTLTVFSVKEIDTGEKTTVSNSDGVSFLSSLRLLVTNRYYLLMLAASAIPAIICVLMLLVVSGLNIQ